MRRVQAGSVSGSVRRPERGPTVRTDSARPVLKESRHSAGAEVVVPHPARSDRDSRHLVIHAADVLLELGRRFGVHGLPGGSQILLYYPVDDLDARLPAYRKGA